MNSYGTSYMNTGPEFTTKEKCEQAVIVIEESGNDRQMFGSVEELWCVRIEK